MLFEKSDNKFLYADPYSLDKQNSNNLYGKRGSMHEDLTMTFSQNTVTSLVWIVVSYNADQSVKDRFDGWEQKVDWTYTMGV